MRRETCQRRHADFQDFVWTYTSGFSYQSQNPTEALLIIFMPVIILCLGGVHVYSSTTRGSRPRQALPTSLTMAVLVSQESHGTSWWQLALLAVDPGQRWGASGGGVECHCRIDVGIYDLREAGRRVALEPEKTLGSVEADHEQGAMCEIQLWRSSSRPCCTIDH